MEIQEIIAILENRLKSLQSERERAVLQGNLESVTQIDINILKTRDTLDKLKVLI